MEGSQNSCQNHVFDQLFGLGLPFAHSCASKMGLLKTQLTPRIWIFGSQNPEKGEPDRDTKMAIFRETSGKFGDFANHFWSPILHRSVAPFFLDRLFLCPFLL